MSPWKGSGIAGSRGNERHSVSRFAVAGDACSWYVKAKLAFEAGEEETGITYLQNAEQTLDVTYMPLRQQITRELETYGAKPVVLEPSLPFTPAPIP